MLYIFTSSILVAITIIIHVTVISFRIAMIFISVTNAALIISIIILIVIIIVV